jgi:hypothetical protein
VQDALALLGAGHLLDGDRSGADAACDTGRHHA